MKASSEMTTPGFSGLVVMISVSHICMVTEGLQFDPGLNHLFRNENLVGNVHQGGPEKKAKI